MEGSAITPNTRVSMSVTKLLSIIGLITTGVLTVAGAWYKLQAHASNQHIHLSETFREQHGEPVGARDIPDRVLESQKLDEIIILLNRGEKPPAPPATPRTRVRSTP